MAEYDNGERHLIEIDHVSVLESVDEIFDGATSLMTLNAVMYGSTITALIAGQPVVGDLDIAVSNQEYMKLCQNFASSVKWLQVDGKRIPERQIPSSRAGKPYANVTAGLTSSNKNPYKEAQHLPVSKMAAFQALNDARVQIIESKTMSGDRLEDALEIVRKVDFTFCGIAVDCFGRMLEVVPHAYDDCNQRVIRIQKYQSSMDPFRLKKRLRKYTKRGWALTLSIDQAMANLNKAKLEYAKRVGKKPKGRKSAGPAFFELKKNSKYTWIIETNEAVSRLIGSNNEIGKAVKYFASVQHEINLASLVNARGRLIFFSKPGDSKKLLGPPHGRSIIEAATNHLRDTFSVTNSRLRSIEMSMASDKKTKSLSKGSGSGSYITSTTTASSYKFGYNSDTS